MEEPARVSVMAERTHAGAPGLDGGRAGRPGKVLLDDAEQPPKAAFAMVPGQELDLELPGRVGFEVVSRSVGSMNGGFEDSM